MSPQDHTGQPLVGTPPNDLPNAAPSGGDAPQPAAPPLDPDALLKAARQAPVRLERAQDHAQSVVGASGTSFGLGMKILPPERRAGMFAVYAFCREIDDIADEGGTRDEKHRALNAWRREIDAIYAGHPTTPTAVALTDTVGRFGLDRQEFILLIEGMEMDVDGPVRAPTMEILEAYCRRVAGAVGLLSMPIFGAPAGEPSDRFALALADALQFTNILRDLRTDALIGRLYLPGDLLEAHGISSADPMSVADDPATPRACRELGGLARQRFAQARGALTDLMDTGMDWRVLRPALLMMGMYEETLKRLEARDFSTAHPAVSLSKATKFAIALRYAIAPPLKSAP